MVVLRVCKVRTLWKQACVAGLAIVRYLQITLHNRNSLAGIFGFYFEHFDLIYLKQESGWMHQHAASVAAGGSNRATGNTETKRQAETAVASVVQGSLFQLASTLHAAAKYGAF